VACLQQSHFVLYVLFEFGICLYQSRLAASLCSLPVCLSIRLFVCPSVRYPTCEHDILKINEPNFDRNWHKLCTGRRHEKANFRVRRSHEAKVRFIGLTEASFLIFLGRVGFLVRIEQQHSVIKGQLHLRYLNHHFTKYQ